MGEALPVGPAREIRIALIPMARAGFVHKADDIAEEIQYAKGTMHALAVFQCCAYVTKGTANKRSAPKPQVGKLMIVQISKAQTGHQLWTEHRRWAWHHWRGIDRRRGIDTRTGCTEHRRTCNHTGV